MNQKFRRHRLNPFKILVLLLYGDHSFVLWADDGQTATLYIPDFARFLRVPGDRFREYLVWLQDGGYLSMLNSARGFATVRLTPPKKRRTSHV